MFKKKKREEKKKAAPGFQQFPARHLYLDVIQPEGQQMQLFITLMKIRLILLNAEETMTSPQSCPHSKKSVIFLLLCERKNSP